MAQIEILKASFGIEEEQQRPEGSTNNSDEGLNPDGFQDPASIMTESMPSNDVDTLIPDEESTHQDDFPEQWQEGVWGEFIDFEQAAKWLDCIDTNAEATVIPSKLQAHALVQSSGVDYIHIAEEGKVLQADQTMTPHTIRDSLNIPTKTDVLVSEAPPILDSLWEQYLSLRKPKPRLSLRSWRLIICSIPKSYVCLPMRVR